MSYLAIARKYRPSTFGEIVGQDHVTVTLRNAIRRGRVHHAFLFTGARGVGKTTAARTLAKALNCERGPTPDPCGQCTSCTEISEGRSPDLIEIDGASNNSVEDVRELREAVRYAPTRAGSKIYLLDEVHMLSKGAFNALLKTLEEPPPHVVFIFATTEPNRIPDTILSRVQRFDFKRIPEQQVVTRLQTIATSEGAEVSEHALRLIARAGEGSMRDAESLLDRVISFSGDTITDADVASTLGLVDRRLLHDMLSGVVRGEPAKCLDVIDTVYGYGYDLSQFTSELLELVRNVTFLRLSGTARAHVDLPADEVATLDRIADGVPPEVLTRVFSAFIDVMDEMNRAGRPRLVLEMAVARLATTRPVQPVSALVDRLQTLQRELRGDGAPQRPRDLKGPGKKPWSDAMTALPQAAQAAPPSPGPAQRPADPWMYVLKHTADVAGAEALVGGEPMRDDGQIVITILGPRQAALARRALALPPVVRALEFAYGNVDVVIKAAAAPQDQAAARLRAQASADPALRRIIDTLGAKLLDVHPVDDAPSSQGRARPGPNGDHR